MSTKVPFPMPYFAYWLFIAPKWVPRVLACVTVYIDLIVPPLLLWRPHRRVRDVAVYYTLLGIVLKFPVWGNSCGWSQIVQVALCLALLDDTAQLPASPAWSGYIRLLESWGCPRPSLGSPSAKAFSSCKKEDYVL